MLAWLPILGPVIEGVIGLFRQKQDVALAKYKEDTVLRGKAIEASTQLTLAFKDDLGVRLARDMIMFPVCVWTMLITWDNIVVFKYPDLVWGVRKFLDGSGLELLPYAVLTFLFGVTAMNIWKR